MAENKVLSVEEAFEFCKRYRAQHKVRMFSQCWGCIKFSNGAPEKMCFYKPPNNDACKSVNQFAQEA